MGTATPPPIPGHLLHKHSSPMGYGTKLALISLIGVLLMIASFIVWGFTSSRETTSNQTAREIAQTWGGKVEIGDVGIQCDTLSAVICPDTYRCSAQIESQTLHRGIYEAQVYDAGVQLSGSLAQSCDTCASRRFVINISPASVLSIDPLIIGGQKYAWNQTETGFETEITSPSSSHFQINLTVKGSKGISVTQCGKRNEVNISGNCPNPSFGVIDESVYINGYGDKVNPYPLPQTRDVTSEHFSATWSNARSLSQPTLANVNFLLGVDRYQKVERSLKYAFLIILFTFLSVFFAERITHYPIPVLNYLLIGLALILFYVLLLSLCEQMAFGYAYTVASAMTICLIAAYMWGMLHSAKVAGTIFAILAVMYASCYVLLCLSTYALIMGSFMLFCALAVSMYASLKIRF